MAAPATLPALKLIESIWKLLFAFPRRCLSRNEHVHDDDDDVDDDDYDADVVL